MAKTHYRKVYKSDHLSVADLEDLTEQGHNLIFIIKKVKQEFNAKVAGKTGNFNIAYFTDEKIKPLVLNAGNADIMRLFNNNSPMVEDWANTPVQLYIDPNAKWAGKKVGGVRISEKQPVLEKKELTPDMTDLWDRAVKALKDGKSIDVITNNFKLSNENREKLLSEATNEI